MRPAFSLMILATPLSAHAFTEDLCWTSSGFENCYRGVCEDGDSGLAECCDRGDEDAPLCLYHSGNEMQDLATGVTEGRSMVHLDATYYLAQAAGIPYATAYVIAAYDEATDTGQYEAIDESGDALSCYNRPQSVSLNGITRPNLPSAGPLVHLSLPHNPAGTAPYTDGTDPDTSDGDHEPLLWNLRLWAFDGEPLCAAGFTSDPDAPDLPSTDGCFHKWQCTTGDTGNDSDCGPGTSATAYIQGDTPTFAGETPMSAFSGQLVMKHSGVTNILGDPFFAVEMEGGTSDDLAERSANLGSDSMSAIKLGIYLHALQDRVSHHDCGDMSSTELVSGIIEVNYDMEECAWDLHALRHVWEVGWANDESTAPETTNDALNLTYDELRAWAIDHGYSTALKTKSAAVAAMLSVLSEPDPEARLDAMTSALNATGFEPLPGHTGSPWAACP